jgi:hypothetical protein
MSFLTTLTFRLLLAITILLHTIPTLVCFLHLQWPLLPHLEIICRPGLAGSTLSVFDVSPMLNSLTARIAALEADIPSTLNSFITHATALETDIPATLNPLMARVAALETEIPTMLNPLIARVAALEADISAMWNSLLFRITTLETNSRELKPARNLAHFGDGARVLTELMSLTWGTKENNWLHGSPTVGGLVYKNPPYVVSDDHMNVGSCWEIEGSAGVLGVLLSEPIHISSMGINNVHPSLVSVASNAKTPRTIALWGMLPNSSIALPTAIERRHPEQFLSKPTFVPKFVKAKDSFVLLLSVHYDPQGTITDQLFKVPEDHWAADIMFRAVLVEILGNWGGQTTCFYRLQIHGRA